MQREIRRIFVRFGVFLLVLALVYLSVILTASLVITGKHMSFSHLPRKVARDQTLLANREVKHMRDIDLLFLGSSHTYRTFDPRFFDQFGWESFNLGSKAQSPLNTYYLVRSQIERPAAD